MVPWLSPQTINGSILLRNAFACVILEIVVEVNLSYFVLPLITRYMFYITLNRNEEMPDINPYW